LQPSSDRLPYFLRRWDNRTDVFARLARFHLLEILRRGRNAMLGPFLTRPPLVLALGFNQIFAWGSSYYLPAVLAEAITAEMNLSLSFATGGLSVGLLVAGIVSPRVGGSINRQGGRPVLALSSVFLGFGLIVLGLALGPSTYVAAWSIIGIGMGAGLYDAAFATLGRLYGQEARHAISALTVIAGFSSTICWPLSYYMLAHFGWRNACFAYAAVQLLVALPIYLVALPSQPIIEEKLDDVVRTGTKQGGLTREQRRIFFLLSVAFTIAGTLSAVVSIHLLIILQDHGVSGFTAISIGALIGPSQVGARLTEHLFGRWYHAMWTLAGSVALSAAGLALLLLDLPPTAFAVVLYGAGGGIGWVARGSVPLALFGPENYPRLLGRLARPSALAQALAPLLGAFIIQRFGAQAILSILAAIAFANVAIVLELFRKARPGSRDPSAT
jgi:MFS family permease